MKRMLVQMTDSATFFAYGSQALIKTDDSVALVYSCIDNEVAHHHYCNGKTICMQFCLTLISTKRNDRGLDLVYSAYKRKISTVITQPLTDSFY